MTTELFYMVSPQDAVALAGVDPSLFQPAQEQDAEGWLRGFLEILARRRSFELLIAQALDAGEKGRALRLAAKTHGPEQTLSEPLLARLEALYQQLQRDCHVRLIALHVKLESVDPEVAEVAGMTEEIRRDLERVALPEARPRQQEAIEEALAAYERLEVLEAEAATLVEMAQQEAQDRRARFFTTARKALERSLSLIEKGRSSEGLEENLLRVLPSLVLARRESLLEAIALAERPLEEPTLQAELAAFAAVASPLPRQLPLRAPAARVNSSSLAALSVLSEQMLRAARPAPRGVGSVEEFRQIVTRADAARSDKESSILWLSMAHSTSEAVLRQGALGYGFLYEGRSLLEQRQYRLATELFRDALQCFYDARQHVEEELFEQAAFGLIATRAWPRLLIAHPGQDTRTHVLDWLHRPQQMFHWLRDNGHAPLLASLAADLPRLDVSEAFLTLSRSHFGAERELLRAYATAILKPQRLFAEPEACLERIVRLLAPASPPETLATALKAVAQDLVSLGKRPLTPAVRGAIIRHLEQIKEELAWMPRNTLAPVEEVQELLPTLLSGRAEGGDVRTGPQLALQPLVRSLRPAERCDEVLVPVLVKNNGLSAIEDVIVQLTLAPNFEGKGIEFCDGGRQVERPVGGLEPGESRQVNFLVNVDKELAGKYLEIRFRWVILAGREVVAEDKTFSVEFRPDDRRTRKSPYTPGEPVTGEHFIGRDKELRQIRDAIVGSSQDRTPLVVGIRRIGKTSVLKETMNDPEVLRKYFPVYVSVEDRPRSETTSSFLIYLCERILEAVPQEHRNRVVFRRAELEAEPYGAFERFTQSLTALELKKRILLVIDEMDWLLKLIAATEERQSRQAAPLKPNEAFQPEVLGAIRKALLFCPALRMIFAGLPVLLQSGYQARIFGLLDPVRVDRFSEEEALRVTDYANNSFTLPPLTRETLFRMTGLQPYLLQVVCHHLFARMVESGRDIVTPWDVDEVIEAEILANESYFTDYLGLMEKSNGAILHGLALAHRAVSREFVSVKEVVLQMARMGEDAQVEEVQAQLNEMCSK